MVRKLWRHCIQKEKINKCLLAYITLIFQPVLNKNKKVAEWSRYINGADKNSNIITLFTRIASYLEDWHRQNSLFRQFKAYSGRYSNIQSCSDILRNTDAY